jgi:uncharacterized protein (TIGR03437 family)
MENVQVKFWKLIAMLSMLVPVALPADYTFTKIADNSPGSMLTWANPPGTLAINASGTVVFKALRVDARGNPTGDVIYTGSGGALTIIADTTGNFRNLFPSSLNSRGTALFGAFLQDFSFGLFTGAGGATSRVATEANDLVTASSLGDINEDGTVAYLAPPAIRIVSNGAVRTVDRETSHTGLSMGQLNRSGSLVFVRLQNADRSIAVDKAGVLSTIVAESSSVYVGSTFMPAMNDNGAVAFIGSPSVQQPRPTLFKFDNGQLTTIVTGTEALSAVNINNNGTVAYARITGPGSSTTGVYIGPDPAADKVIAVGDSLFGSRLGSIDGPGKGNGRYFNDRGQIAFYYTLANGERGVAVATPAAPSAGAPVLPADSVLNAATLTATALAPGSIVSLFGDRFSSDLLVPSTATLPTSLSGVSVTFNGIAAPLYFVSPKQINTQVPFELTGTSAQVQVRTPGGQSEIRTLTIGLYSPGIYTLAQSGTGQGIVTFADTSTLVAPRAPSSDSRPARVGDIITIYANGLGAVNPSIASAVNSCGGVCLPDFSNLVLRRLPVVPGIEIGGVRVTEPDILFAGLAPQFVGLYQINLRLPAGIAPSNSTAVVLRQGSTAASRSGVIIATE